MYEVSSEQVVPCRVNEDKKIFFYIPPSIRRRRASRIILLFTEIELDLYL